MACKCKFLPHNWFCLKGLYWIFVSLFYLTIAYAIYIVVLMSTTPMLTGAAYWESLFNFLINAFSIMLGFITVAKLIKAVAKIKKAVAPCCCEAHKEEVVVVSSQDK
ncbi:MAG: hypothetical protein IJ311_04795 [Elusimicrobiaceae bacterium]|nr:hypothetical protein [Elusimicrobiaceae bacterium]